MTPGSGISISPAYQFMSVTPSDSDVLKYTTTGTSPYGTTQTVATPGLTKGISCAVTGNIAVKNDQGTTVIIYIAAGVIHPIATYQILSSSTTATGIVAYF